MLVLLLINRKHISRCIANSQFPDDLKVAEIVLIQNLKCRYRPLSILPNVLKPFEKSIYDRLANFFDNIFSQYQPVVRTARYFLNGLMIIL